MFASDQHHVLPFEHPTQEWLACPATTQELRAGIQCRADTATEPLLGTMKCGEDLIERKLVGNQQHIDVAGRGVRLLGNRSVQQRELNAGSERSQSDTKLLGNASGLLDDRTQLLEDWRSGICTVPLLSPGRDGGDQLAVDSRCSSRCTAPDPAPASAISSDVANARSDWPNSSENTRCCVRENSASAMLLVAGAVLVARGLPILGIIVPTLGICNRIGELEPPSAAFDD